MIVFLLLIVIPFIAVFYVMYLMVKGVVVLIVALAQFIIGRL